MSPNRCRPSPRNEQQPRHPPWRRSSALPLGLEVVSGDGVGDDEDFPHDSDEGDLSGSIVVVGDAIVEVAHRGGMADSGAGGVEQGAAHERSSMTGFGLPFSFSAFAGMGSEADEG